MKTNHSGPSSACEHTTHFGGMTPTARTPRILRLKQILPRVGISRAQLYALKKDGRFPENFSLSGPGGRAVGWLESDIDDWVASRTHMSVGASKLGGQS